MYQPHSETSQEAYKLAKKAEISKRIFSFIDSDPFGKTIDQVSESFRIVPGTASARVRELEDDGLIIKTKRLRKTRKDRNANIYVTNKHFREGMQRASTKENSKIELKRLREEVAILRSYLDNIAKAQPFFYNSRPGDLVKIAQTGLERANKVGEKF